MFQSPYAITHFAIHTDIFVQVSVKRFSGFKVYLFSFRKAKRNKIGHH